MSRLSRGQMIAGIGGIVLIISLFLSWISLPAGFGSASAFDAFSGMDIIMLIVGIAAIAWAASAAAPTAVTLPASAPWIVGLLGVAMIGWCLGNDLEDSNAGVGAWLGLIGSAAIAWGCLAPGRPAPVATRPTTGATTPPPAPPAV